MPWIVNVLAGIVCLGLSANFFRMAFQMEPSHGSEAVAAKPGKAICAPSGDLLGISKEDLLARCGAPRSVNHQTLSGGSIRKEQWSYRDPVFYVYLSNDKTESIQYAENGQNFEWKN